MGTKSVLGQWRCAGTRAWGDTGTSWLSAWAGLLLCLGIAAWGGDAAEGGREAVASVSRADLTELPLRRDPDDPLAPFVVGRYVDCGGNEIVQVVVPGRPPATRVAAATVVALPSSAASRGVATLSGVPTFDWTYGCSATSAGMMCGYYDRNGLPGMYTGGTNGGVCPTTNATWGSGECPFVASHMGLDGRATKGHVDDYWYAYGSTQDPYYGNWTPHNTPGTGDCLADFMGTNQYYPEGTGSSDGSTRFWYYSNGAPLAKTDFGDGLYGVRLYMEYCGYNVVSYFSQYIYGYKDNTLGFTFSQFKAQIDAGRPVLIHVTGHTMLGVGYDDSTQKVYIHDTWNHSVHEMTWGGTYSDMTHYAVGVVQVTKKSQTITFAALPTRIYGGASFGLAATATSGLDVSFASSNATVATVSGTTVTIVGAGTATITASQAGDDYWAPATNVDRSLVVNPKSLTVTPDAGQSKLLGQDDPVLSYTASGSVSGETAAFSGALSRVPGEDAGTYEILVGTLAPADNAPFLAANYEVALVPGVTFSIATKNAGDLTVGDVGPFAYDGTAQTPEPEVKDGTTVLVKGTDYTLSYAGNTNVGTATITVTGIGAYAGTQDKDFEIQPRPLTVTPDAGQSKVLGEDDPVFAYTPSGAAAGETAAFTGALSRTAGEDVGTYEIQAGTLALADNAPFLAANYALSVAPGATFAVTAKDASTLTVAAVGPFTYDGTAQTPEPEVRDGDTILFKDTHYTLAYASNTDAGAATVTVTGIGNYTGTQDKEFEIQRRTLTVTPGSGQSKAFGEADPVFVYTHSGAVAGETPAFSGALSRVAGENAGTYEIQLGTLALADNSPFLAANYTLSLTAGVTFAITHWAAVSGNPSRPVWTVFLVESGNGSIVVGDEVAIFAGDTLVGWLLVETAPGAAANPACAVKAWETLADGPGYTAGQAYAVKVWKRAAGVETTATVSFPIAGGYEGATFPGDDSPYSAVALRLDQNIDFADLPAKTYGNPAFVLGATATSGLPVSFASSDSSVVNLSEADGTWTATITGAGTATITASQAGDAIWMPAEDVPVVFSVGKAELAVTPTAGQSKTFGEEDPVLAYTHSGAVAGETPAFSGALSRAAGDSVGTYEILVGTLALADNSPFLAANYTLSLTPGVPFAIDAKNAGTLTVGPVGPFEYDGTAHMPEPTVHDGATPLVKNTNYTLSYANNTNAGTATVTVTGIGNYTGTQGEDFVIEPRALTVTPTAGQSKTFGEEDPVLAYTHSGAVAGETPAFSGALSRAAGDSVGTYEILVGTLALADNSPFLAANYTLSLTPGVPFAIDAKNAGTLAIGPVGPFEYDGTAHMPEPTVHDGATPLVKNTNYTLSYANNTNAGTATVTVTGIGNYTGTQGEDFAIEPRALTVTPTAGQSKTFGAADPVLAYTHSGAVAGETPAFSGALSRAAGDSVGTYEILVGTLALAGNSPFLAANYTLSLTPGVPFAIDAKNAGTLTVGPVGPFEYDGTAHMPEPTVHDGATPLVKNTNYTLSYANNTNAGTATVTVTGIGNYTGTQGEDFAIEPRALTVTPTAGQSKTFGAADPVLAYTHSGAVAGETPAFSGALSRAAGDSVGTYEILVGTLALADNSPFLAANYTLSLTPGVPFAIDAKNAGTLTVGPVGPFEYDGTAHMPEPTVHDGATPLVKNTDYTLSYANNTNAGTATVTVTGIGNYTGTQGEDFAIEPRALTVTPTAGQSKTFGEEDPVLAYTHSGAVAGETPAFSGALSRAPGDSVGTYEILVGTLALADNSPFLAANYTLSFSPGTTFAIDAKNAGTLTVGPVGPFEYDGTAHMPEPTVHDGATPLVKNTDYTLSYANNTNAGTATVTVTGIGNYTGTQGEDFAIEPRALTVTPTAGQSKTFGEEDPVLAYTHSGAVAGETPAFSGALSRAAGDSVGTYEILVGTLALADNSPFLATNYTLSFSPGTTFAIDAKNAGTLTVGPVGPFEYDGTAHMPEPTVHDGATPLVKNTNYTLSYANNTNAGTATVTVTGIGNYTGTQGEDFVIEPRALTVTPTAGQSKTFGEEDPVLAYTHSGAVAGETPAFSGALSRAAGDSVGTYEILVGTLALADNSPFLAANYTLSLTPGVPFAIDAKNAGTLTVGPVGPFEYDGTAHMPEPTVHDGATPLVKNTNYTLSYANNTNAGTATVTVTGIGNYTGTQGEDFVIEPRALTVTPTAGQSKTFGEEDPVLAYTHSGAVAGETPAFSGALSRAAGDSVGTYEILVGTLALAGNSPFLAANYTLSLTPGVPFAIDAKNAGTLTVGPVGPFEYDGTAHMPEPTVHDGATPLVKNTNYTLSYANNTNAGTATVTVTGIGNYTGTQGEDFAIEPRALTVTPTAGQSKTFGEEDPVLAYTHSGAVAGETPAFSGALSRAAGDSVGTYEILVGTLALADNSPFLAANYTLSFSPGTTFAIDAKNAGTLTVGPVGPFEYDGTAHMPEPTVHDGATPLVKNTDYTLSYADNTNAGTATVTVTGIGNYTGTQGEDFAIEPRALTVTPTAGQSKTFGEEDPVLAYTHSGAVAGETPAFSGALSRAAGDSVGTYEILVGTLALADNSPFLAANYTLSFSPGTTFAIDAKNAGTLTVGPVGPFEYDGTAHMPEPTVHDGATPLVKNTNYTLSYANNTNAGTATVTVTGIGNYTGTQGEDFVIEPRALTVTPTAGQSKTFGAADPVLAYTHSGAVAGETPAFSGALSRAAGDSVGTYEILVGTLALAGNSPFLAANYTLSLTPGVPFAIDAKNAGTLTVGPVGPFEYDGTAHMPEPTVHDGATPLVKNTNYTLSYANNTNAGTATVTVTGIGNYTGTQGEDFAIEPRALTVTPTAGQSKTFGEEDPVLAYTHSGAVAGETPAFSGALSRAAGDSVGTYEILVGTLALADNSPFLAANYTLSLTPGVPFAIDAKNAGTLTVGPVGPFEYDGTAHMPEPTVHDGATPLVKNTNYTLSYANNTNAGTATVTVTGIGNYTGTQGEDFAIEPRALTVTPTAGQSKTFGAADPVLAYTHSGAVAGETPAFSGALSRAAGDSVGTYEILVGTLALADNSPFLAANYTLSFTPGVPFAIDAKNAGALAIGPVGPFEYDGTAHMPEPTVHDGATPLVKNTNYTLSYANNTNAGTATVTVTGIGNYTGTQGEDFEIEPRGLTVTPTAGQSKTFGEEDPVLAYTHSGAVAGETPAFSGALSRAAGDSVGTYEILVGTLALADNSPFLAANYTLSLTPGVPFAIDAKNAGTLAVGPVGPFEYDGTAHMPEPTVHDGATPLVKNTNYTLSYANNTNAGTATVTVTGIGNYTGTQGEDFEIEPRGLTVTPTAGQSKTFGEEDPVLAYTHSGAVAGETPAFSGALSRAAGDSVGTYEILVGTLALADNSPFLAANYTLSFSPGTTFAIDAKNASALTIGPVGPFEYDGTAHMPEPTVHDGATPLVKNTNYTLSYANNTNAGTATVTVTGIGNYTGTQGEDFVIEPRALTVTPTAGQSKAVGAADPVLAYTHSGAVAGEAPAFSGALSRAPGEDAGTYAILVGTLALADNSPFLAANYTLSFAGGVTFAVTHWPAVSGNPAQAVWTIYLLSASLDGVPLGADDEIAILDGNTLVGSFALAGSLSGSVDPTEALKAWSELSDGPGYVPGNAYTFVCWHGATGDEYPLTGIQFDTDGDAYAGDAFPGGTSPYSAVDLEFSARHEIALGTGFQFVSSPRQPTQTSLLSLTEDMRADGSLNFVRDSDGNTLQKVFGTWVDGIGNWDAKQGYLFRMDAPATLTIVGPAVGPQTALPLHVGFQFVPYLPSYELTAREAFDGLISADPTPLDFVRASNGDALQEIFGSWLDGIGTMYQGQGYLVKTNAETGFSYPPDSGEAGALGAVAIPRSARGARDRHWPDVSGDPSESVWTVFLVESGNGSIVVGDEVAIFAGDTRVGCLLVETAPGAEANPECAVKAWEVLADGPGYTAGEPYTVKVWKAAAGVETTATLAFPIEGAYEGAAFPADDSPYSAVALRLDQSIDFADLPAKTYGDAPFVLGATATSDLAVSFASSDSSVVSLTETDGTWTATITGAGTATITASQAGDAVWMPAEDVPVVLSVGMAALTVAPNVGQSKTFGEEDPVLAHTHSGAIADETPAFSGALSRAVGENVGTYEIQVGTLALADNSPFLAANYTLSLTGEVTFAIDAKNASTLAIGPVGPFTYDGTAHTPEPEVKDGDTILVKDVDYALSYADNTNVGAATVTVTGIGNYTGTQDKDFEIQRRTLTVTPEPGQSRIFGTADPLFAYTHSGAVAGETPAFSGALSRAPGDDVGTYEILAGTLAPTDNAPFLAANYTLSVTPEVTFAVTAKDVGTFTVGAAGPFTYDGNAHTPEPEVKDGDTVLVKDADYTLSYADNTNAGTATVTVTGIGNYGGTRDGEFEIQQRALAVAPDAGQSKIFGAADPVFAHTSSGAVPGETPAFSGALSRAPGETVGTYGILAGTLAPADNAPFLATNYTLSVTPGVTFAVTAKDAGTLTVAAAGPFTYDGTAHTPEPEVKDGATVLVKDADYTLSYADHTDAGVATVTVTGIGNYTGTQDKGFEIQRRALVVAPDPDQSKIFGAADPVFAYTHSGAVAGEAPAFLGALSRAPGETVGTYEILAGTLAPASNAPFLATNYTFLVTPEVTFAITAKDAGTFTVAAVGPFAYNGTAHTPEPEVKDGDTVLVKDADYTLSYADNINAGTASVTVTGIGNYAGTQDQNFGIEPKLLRVRALDKEKAYDGSVFPVGAYTVSYEGFAPGEDAGVLQGELVFAGSAVGAIHAGTYTITPAGPTSANYQIVFDDGVLTIHKADQTIEFAALDTVASDALPFALNATATSSLPVRFASSDTAVVEVAEDNGTWKATVVGVGEATITAGQDGDADWNPAAAVSQRLVVHPVLTVVNGTGGGAAVPGDPVSIAEALGAGRTFKAWTCDPAEFAGNLVDYKAPQTEFRMPNVDVTLTATYDFDAPEWLVSMDIDGALPKILAFGMHQAATGGWDEGLEETGSELPPTAGSATLTSADLSESYALEYRPPAESAEFLAVVCSDSTETTVTWEPPVLPAGKFLSIREVVPMEGADVRAPLVLTPVGNTALDMGVSHSLTVPAGETRYYAIHYGDELLYDLTFHYGWNLVSLPITPLHPEVDAVLDDGSGMPIHEGAVRLWNGSAYDVATTLEACIGYWIYVRQPRVLLVRGTRHEQDTIELSKGWNLVGPTRPRSIPASSRAYGSTWIWHSATLRYRASDCLWPGHGHWIWTGEAESILLGDAP